jgi:hypothetical protein
MKLGAESFLWCLDTGPYQTVIFTTFHCMYGERVGALGTVKKVLNLAFFLNLGKMVDFQSCVLFS